LPHAWRALRDCEASAWRGLAVAAGVALVLAGILALSWPAPLVVRTRWSLAAALAVIAPLLHLLLLRVPAPRALSLDDEEVFEPVIDAAPRVPAPVAAAAPTVPPLAAAPATPAIDPAALAVQLHDAARAGRVDQALALLEAGADVHAEPPAGRDQRSLAVLAAVLPDLRLLRALIARGLDVNRAHAGMTPLLAATRDSWHGRPDAVMMLLANGADPRATDSDGSTPMHHAARSSDPGVAALLRDAAADLEVLNRDGWSPLGVACASGNWRLAKFLLERGARPEPRGGQPALLAAAAGEDDDPAGVQLLLRHKARVDTPGRDGRRALHEAAFAGHVEIVAALLDAGSDANGADASGRTPLLEAARGGHADVLDVLLDHAPSAALAAAVDGEGHNALALAVTAEHCPPALIERLLERGVDPQQRAVDGKRAVDVAAELGRWSLLALLDPNYALPTAVREDDSAQTPPADIAPLALLREGLRDGRADLDTLVPLVSRDELGALLHDDRIADDANRVDWLLRHGANPDVTDARGDGAAFLLLAQGPQAIDSLHTLLRHGVQPTGAGGLARFLAATLAAPARERENAETFALELIERGADLCGSSRAGDPPLSLAVHLGWSRVAERLLGAGAALDARDSHGMGALHLAAALGRDALLRQLIAHGASPDLLAADGQTPLGVALASGRRDLADWLDWRGWALPGRPLRASDVPAAAIVGDADAVRRLLDLGLPVDAIDSQGCTALLRAAGGGHRTVVDLLLARGADAGRGAHSGATPLSAAVSMRHSEIVDRLLASGAALEQRLPGELTALMVAAALGLPDLVARLLRAGADVQATDAQGRTALHCATMFGFTARERVRLVALLDTLLLAGADVDRDAAGATPLLMLLGARAEPGTASDEDVLIAGVERLLDDEAALDAQDPRGFGPLHLAALHGLMRTVQRLLQAGADPELRDTLNRTPREIALMRGFVDIAAELAPAAPGQPVSMARFLRDR